MPGRLMSNVYLARPVTLSGPSRRFTWVPTTVGVFDHWNFGSTGVGGGPPRPPPGGGCCGAAPRPPGCCAPGCWTGGCCGCGIWFCGCGGCAGGVTGTWLCLSTKAPLHARDRFEDAVERAAAADVAVEPGLDLLGRRVGMLLEQADAGHDETRRAEAAHQGVLVAERLLHRVQRCAIGQAVDVANLLALDVDRQRRARIHRPAVHQHRARAAGAAVADALVARHVGAHAQRVEQRDPRLDHQVELAAVDGEPHRHVAGADFRNPGLSLSLALEGGNDRRRNPDKASGVEKAATAEVATVRRIVVLGSHLCVHFRLSSEELFVRAYYNASQRSFLT